MKNFIMAPSYLITVCALIFVTAGYCQTNSNGGEVSFTYTLWVGTLVGTDVTESYSLDMVAPKGLSFFNMMHIAAEINPKFEFEFKVTERPPGNYVTAIAGHKEEPDDYYFWMLYRLPEKPDPASAPGDEFLSPVGVDSLLVEDGGNYLFWLKEYRYEIPTTTLSS